MPFRTDVVPLHGPAYFSTVLGLLGQARERIDVFMYVVGHEEDARRPSRQLWEALGAAAERGVAVRFLLGNDPVDRKMARAHGKVIEALRPRGVDARLAEPAPTLHDKIVVVDGGRAVVVGTHNWTEHSLFKAREASYLLLPHGPPEELGRYVERTWAEASPRSS